MENSENKTKSSLQKKLNKSELLCTKYYQKLVARKEWIKSANELFEKLKAEGRITNEELMEYFPRKNKE